MSQDVAFSLVFPDAPPSLLREAVIRRVEWSGNQNLAGCPLYRGWTIRFDGHTTDHEKAWLKRNGFSFHGGKWGRGDLVHYAIAGEHKER